MIQKKVAPTLYRPNCSDIVKREMVKYRSLTHIVFKIFGTSSVDVAQ